jgi:hypothetical protein
MTFVWEADPACLGDSWDALDSDVKQRSLMLATSSLQMLTYNRVGTAPITIRPCPQVLPCACGHWRPVLSEDGQWFNCGTCKRAACKPTSEIDLPGPVGFIDSVKVNGVEIPLDTGAFRIDNGHLLVWQGEGASPFPETQDLNKADTEAGTWSVTYSRSYPVLQDGRIAVAYLAAEFAKACVPKAKCSLPRGVTNVVRNGVSFSIQAGLFPNGLTNIDVVDQYILKWAPAGSPAKTAQVFDPRTHGPRVTSSVPLRRPTGSA